jgi:hypothetical protein
MSPVMPRRPRLLLAVATAVLAVAPAAAHAAAVKHTQLSQQSYKGGIVVRHERVTVDGRTSNVTTVTMPKPDRSHVLEPILPGDVVSKGTMTTSKASKAMSRYGTAVAINADLFEYASGQSSGMLMIDDELYNQPQGGRPALSIGYDGILALSTPRARGTLDLPGGRKVPFEVNVKRADGVVTYDRGWGATAPSGGTGAVLRIGPGSDLLRKPTSIKAIAPNLKVVRTGASGQIPTTGSADMLFQGYGKAAKQLKGLKRGQTVGMHYTVGPIAPKTRFAIGGGPVLIRDGKVVYDRKKNTEFSDGQLVPPDARTAVGQTKDGKIIYYVVDQGSGSAGFTVPDVAKDLKRMGAVRAMTFDSGGSTAVSVNGSVLNKPSDGYERPVGTVLMYFAPKKGYSKPIADVHVGDRPAGSTVPELSFAMKGRAAVEVRLTDPRGSVYGVRDGTVSAGTHAISTPDKPRVGKWTVEVAAPDYGDRVVKSFTVTATPKVVAADKPQAPAASRAPLIKAPVAEAKPTGALPAKEKDTYEPPSVWLWILVGVGIVGLGAIGVLIVRRRS